MIKITRTSSAIEAGLRNKQRQLAQVPQLAHNFFVRVTPKDTGNARNKTKLAGDTIQANYPYATRLNKGWSRQAPSGMTMPTMEYIRALLRRIFG